MSNPKRSNVSTVADEYLCNSCGACYASCSQGAIRYTETSGGYLFPEIDNSACVSCGLCHKVCPGVHLGETLQAQIPIDPFVGNILSCEVGRAVDEKIYVNSQSGGVTTAILAHLFDVGKITAAIVAVMRESTPPRGDVVLVRSADELLMAQKSKYTPIPILKALRGQGFDGPIALSGLPCHIHGLHNLIDTLPGLSSLEVFKIGLVCDRIMTSAAIDYMGSCATRKPIKSLVYRDKQRPSYPGNPVVKTAGEDQIVLKASLRMAIKDFFTPARCRLCFDKLNVFADVVLGDPHGIQDVDRMHGETLVLGRTEKGHKLIDSAKEAGSIVLRKTPVDAAIKGQGIEKKRLEWAGYMDAWDGMGRTRPHYPTPLNPSVKLKPYRQSLMLGLKLDEFKSKQEIIRSANNWLLLRYVRKVAFSPFFKIKGLARRVGLGNET